MSESLADRIKKRAAGNNNSNKTSVTFADAETLKKTGKSA